MADSITPARRVALTVLTALARTPGRRGADEHLDDVLDKAQLSPADRKLAQALVYGVLRWQRRLDAVLREHAKRGLPKDAWVRSALRAAAFQLLFLDRIPSTAAVNTAVEAVKQGGRPEVAGFANAVLRKVAQEQAPLADWPVRGAGISEWAEFASFPDWIVKVYADTLGANYGGELRAANTPAPLVLRAAPGLRDAVLGRLTDHVGETVTVSPGRWAPDAIAIAGSVGDVTLLPGFDAGEFTVQDEAAQLITLLLAPQPGDRVLDVAAAPGGKAIHAAQLVGPAGQVVAVDVDARRLDRTARAAARMQASLTLVEADATGALPDDIEPESFDRVLVDAPCSALGIIRRKPDIKWARQPRDLPRLAERQAQMLAVAARYVKPGGALLYSVCTLSREETMEVSQNLQERGLERRPAWDDAPDYAGFAFGDIEDIDFLSLPGAHGTDGFYAARWVRTG